MCVCHAPAGVEPAGGLPRVEGAVVYHEAHAEEGEDGGHVDGEEDGGGLRCRGVAWGLGGSDGL